jgi:hypothetical protein
VLDQEEPSDAALPIRFRAVEKSEERVSGRLRLRLAVPVPLPAVRAPAALAAVAATAVRVATSAVPPFDLSTVALPAVALGLRRGDAGDPLHHRHLGNGRPPARRLAAAALRVGLAVRRLLPPLLRRTRRLSSARRLLRSLTLGLLRLLRRSLRRVRLRR